MFCTILRKGRSPMGFTVLIPQDIPAEGKQLLEQMGCTVKMGRGHTEQDIIADIADCEAVVTRTAPYTRAVLEAGKKLKIISRYGVGVDNIDLKAADELGIWVANTPQANSATVAEHAIAMMMACAIDLVNACVETRNGNFAYRNQVMGTDLGGKTLGIVGVGKIGAHMAKIASAGFGMRVIGYDPYVAADKAPAGVTMVKEWDAVFRDADFVSVHLPLTDKTRRAIGAREFGLMRKTAYFINCARGEVVAEQDLVAALRAGRIAGAALDVFDKEPPDADNPLFSMKNVVVTPHDASFTRESFARMGEHMAKNIQDVMSGNRPTWPVNKPASR